MKKIKIRLYNEDSIQNFIKIARSFLSDINVYDDSMIIDGKSILGMYTIGYPKEVEVQIISDSIEEERRFDSEMEAFTNIESESKN